VVCVWQLRPLAERRRAQLKRAVYSGSSALAVGQIKCQITRVASGCRRSPAVDRAYDEHARLGEAFGEIGLQSGERSHRRRACYCAMIDWRTRRRSLSSSSSFQRQNAIR
jgi:hypothetical protein